MFSVIKLDNESNWIDAGLGLFQSQRDAAQAAQAANIGRFKIIAEKSDSWIERETGRFVSGKYQPIFWADDSWWTRTDIAARHFAHVAESKANRIAYTESDEHGAADRQTLIAPGRYLKKYFSDVLGDSEIETLANQFVKAHGGSLYELKISKDGRGIVAAYQEKKLGSCMHFGNNEYNSSVHPCFVYGAGDIECATAWHEGECVARCLIWRREGKKTLVGRIYGHVEAMQAALSTAGIATCSNNSSYDELEGARLIRIEDSGGYVIPYIDGTQFAQDNGSFLIIDSCGDIDSHTSHSTGGLSGHTHVCDSCEDGVDECSLSTVMTTYGAESWCDCCRDNRAFYCEATEEHYNEDQFTCINVISRHGYTVSFCEERSNYSYFYCEENNEYYDSDYYSEIIINDYSYCSENIEFATCCYSGDYFFLEDMVLLESGEHMAQEHFESEGFTCYKDGLNYSKSDNDYLDDEHGNTWLLQNAESDPLFIADCWHDLPHHPNSTLRQYRIIYHCENGYCAHYTKAQTALEAVTMARAILHHRVKYGHVLKHFWGVIRTELVG